MDWDSSVSSSADELVVESVVESVEGSVGESVASLEKVSEEVYVCLSDSGFETSVEESVAVGKSACVESESSDDPVELEGGSASSGFIEMSIQAYDKSFPHPYRCVIRHVTTRNAGMKRDGRR